MRDHGNWDYDHPNGKYRKTKHIPYSMYDRSATHRTHWASDRHQHNSSFMRRRYISSANKHTRQLLKLEMMEELNA